MVVGGSKWQMDIIKCVKDHGFDVIVTDISSEAPGSSIADVFYQIDSNDKEELTSIARKHKISFAIAEQTDRVVPSVAYINEKLGLRGIKPNIASCFTDKYIMRNKLKMAGLLMPDYFLVKSVVEAVQVGHSLGFPLILKPRTSQSSLGVFKIQSVQELVIKFNDSLQFSKDGSLLMEEYIPGIEITVEGFCIGHKCFPLAISEKEHYPQNDCVSRKLIYPPSFDNLMIQSIRHYIIDAVETLGLDYGIFHAELKVNDTGVTLIEVAARGGGHNIASVIVPHVSGINIYDLLIRSLNGDEVSIEVIDQKAAVLGFFDFSPGKVTGIRGLEEIKNDKRIHEIHFNFKEGDEIKQANDDITRAGYYIALCNNRAEIELLDKKILSSVYVEYDVLKAIS
jgi:carbamoyl-phosphate synthase large subunit